MVSQDGRPREDVTVAHFHVSHPRALPAPRGLQVRRRGSGLVVSFKGVSGAAGYVLSIRLSDGRSVYLKLAAGKHGAIIPAVARNLSAHVELAALLAGTRVRAGRHARFSLKAGPQPPRTVVAALKS
jgi:hypothetical protein